MAIGQSFRELLAVLTRHRVDVDQLSVMVLDLDAVIESKRATGRPKDRAALPLLLETRRLRRQA